MKNLLLLFILCVSLSFNVADDQRSVTKHLLFDINSAYLSAESKAEMDAWSKGLKNANIGSIEIIGFAGPLASSESIQAFGLMRAHVVKEYLLDMGLSEDKIEISYQDATALACDEIPEGIRATARAEVHMSFVKKIPRSLREK